MFWLNPAALFALAAATAPVLIHLLVRRRAERFPFPTLRFLQPTRLASIRRHLIDDLPLLAVRIALLAAAVAALAGPLLVTAARRRAWDRRIVRAVVVDATDVAPAFQAGDRPERAARQQSFRATSLPDGIRRAILWLDTAPPARREIVVSSAFPIGSITPADVDAIPADIGVRVERSGTLPRTRTVPGGQLLTADGVRAREVTFDGDRTSVRDAAADPLAWPIDVVSSKADQPAVDAAIAAILSQRVWAGRPDRRARVVLVEANPDAALRRGAPKPVGEGGGAAVIRQPWMADAISRIAADRELREAAARVAAGLSETRFAAAPWQILASAADGRPFAVAAGSPDRLVVASAARASDLATPLLLRSIANAIAAPPDVQPSEVVPIADVVLQRWSRPAAPLWSPRLESVDQDDRRWLWLAVLCLMVLEMWLRRARGADAVNDSRREDARVVA